MGTALDWGDTYARGHIQMGTALDWGDTYTRGGTHIEMTYRTNGLGKPSVTDSYS